MANDKNQKQVVAALSASTSVAMGHALVSLDGIAMPDHPLAGYGSLLQGFTEFTDSNEAQQLRDLLRGAGQRFAAQQVRRSQEKKDTLVSRYFKTSEREEQERRDRETAAVAAGWAVEALLWGGEAVARKYAARRDRRRFLEMVWNGLRFAAHDTTHVVPLHLEHHLIAVMHRLGATKAEMNTLAALPVPTRATDLFHFPQTTAEPLRYAVCQVAALAVAMNRERPGAVTGRGDLRQYLRTVVQAPRVMVDATLSRLDDNYDATVDDLSELAVEATRRIVAAAATVRLRMPNIDFDAIARIAERAGAYDPRKATRDRIWSTAVEALRAGAPLAVGAAASAWLGPAAALGAHGVARAMVTGLLAPRELKAVVAELERAKLVEWEAHAESERSSA